MKLIKLTTVLIIFLMLVLFIQPVEAIDLSISDDGLIVAEGVKKEDANDAWNDILGSYKIFVLGFFAIASISMVFLFIVNFLRLGTSAGNPGERSKAITGVLWTGIATAILGGTMFFFSMFYNLF